MGTAIFFGNRRVSQLQLKPGALEKIGIKTAGPVLSGQMSVNQARELALLHIQNKQADGLLKRKC